MTIVSICCVAPVRPCRGPLAVGRSSSEATGSPGRHVSDAIERQARGRIGGTTQTARRGRMGTAVRRGRARRRRRWPRRGWTRRASMKMLLTCRSTVRSLIVRASAIARLVSPAATRRRTSTSRALRPPGRERRGGRASPGRARSAAAPSRSNTSRAASVSSGGAVMVAERATRIARSGPGPSPLRTGHRARARLPTPGGGPPARPGRRLPRAARRPRPGWPSPAGAARRATRRVSPGDPPPRGPRRGRPAARAISTAGSSSLAADQVVGRLGHRTPDRGDRGVDLTLRQPQQRESGLGQAAPRAGLAIPGLCTVEPPAQGGRARPAGRSPPRRRDQAAVATANRGHAAPRRPRRCQAPWSRISSAR